MNFRAYKKNGANFTLAVYWVVHLQEARITAISTTPGAVTTAKKKSCHTKATTFADTTDNHSSQSRMVIRLLSLRLLSQYHLDSKTAITLASSTI